jgi:hypothetical protein
LGACMMVGYVFKEHVKNRGRVAPASMTRVAWGKMKRGVTVWAVLKTVAGQQGSEWGSCRFGDPSMKQTRYGVGRRLLLPTG